MWEPTYTVLHNYGHMNAPAIFDMRMWSKRDRQQTFYDWFYRRLGPDCRHLSHPENFDGIREQVARDMAFWPVDALVERTATTGRRF